MKIIKLRIDGQFFFLRHDEDVSALKEAIVDAAASGPRFIDFTTIDRSEVSVLMTPNLPARFEVLERTDEEISDLEQSAPVIDVDYYGHEHIG